MDYQILYGFDYGGQKITFDKPLLNKVKYMCAPEILLLGFKPRACLKDYHNIKHSSFIYPDEAYVKGKFFGFIWTYRQRKHRRFCSPSRQDAFLGQNCNRKNYPKNEFDAKNGCSPSSKRNFR